MSYAIAYKAAAAAAQTVPDDWPGGWDFPEPFPPGWPQAAPASHTITVTVDATLFDGLAASVEARVLDSLSADTDVLEYQTLRVTAANSSSSVIQLKEDAGDSYANSIDLQVTNYNTTKYGFDDTVIFDLSGEAENEVITVTVTAIHVTPNIVGTDTGVATFDYVIVTSAIISDAFPATTGLSKGSIFKSASIDRRLLIKFDHDVDGDHWIGFKRDSYLFRLIVGEGGDGIKLKYKQIDADFDPATVTWNTKPASSGGNAGVPFEHTFYGYSNKSGGGTADFNLASAAGDFFLIKFVTNVGDYGVEVLVEIGGSPISGEMSYNGSEALRLYDLDTDVL